MSSGLCKELLGPEPFNVQKSIWKRRGYGRKGRLSHSLNAGNAHFVRSLTYRSTDNDRMPKICAAFQYMKKNAVKREQGRKEMENVVTQDNLVEIRNRRPQRLGDIYVRPALEGKRVPGEVEIHQNGLRYQSPVHNDHRIDVLFSNVKHLFFQPCTHGLIVLIQVYLKDPIMVGKKKTKDVQFYREATDIQFDETGNRKRGYRYGDGGEFEQEQEERRRRALLDKKFKAFADKISEAGKKHENGIDIVEGFQGKWTGRSSKMPDAFAMLKVARFPAIVRESGWLERWENLMEDVNPRSSRTTPSPWA